MPRASPGTSVIGYIAAHPVQVAHLAAARVATELANVRPYYSDLHNIKILLSLIPLYALASVGGWVYRKIPAVRLILMVIATHVIVIAATFADYDGRFLLHFISLIIVLSGVGAAQSWRYITDRRLRRAQRVDVPGSSLADA